MNKIVTLVIIFLFLLGGCSKEIKPSKQTVKIFSLNWVSGQKLMQDFSDSYMQKNPDIEIIVEELPWDAYFQNVELRLKSANPDMDVVIVDIPMLASYAARGFLSDLTPYISVNEVHEKLAKATADALLFNNNLYASGMQNSAQFLYISKNAAQKAGIQLPEYTADKYLSIDANFVAKWGAKENRWTWAQTVIAAKALQKVTDSTLGLHLEQAGRLYQLQPLGGSFGGQIVGSSGVRVKGYLDQAPWQNAVEFYTSLFRDGLEQKSVFTDPFEWGARFDRGDIDILIGGEWNIARMKRDDYAILPHPYFNGGTVKTPTGSWVAAISAKSQVQEEAASFIRYLTLSEEGTELWFDILGQLPASKTLLNKLLNEPKYDEFPKKFYRLGAYEALNTAEARPVSPFYPIISDGFETIFRDAALGKDPHEALQEGVEKIQNDIDRLQ